MSLLSSLIIPHLEDQLVQYEPEIAHFILIQIKNIGGELLDWTTNKIAEHEQLKKNLIVGQENG